MKYVIAAHSHPPYDLFSSLFTKRLDRRRHMGGGIPIRRSRVDNLLVHSAWFGTLAALSDVGFRPDEASFKEHFSESKFCRTRSPALFASTITCCFRESQINAFLTMVSKSTSWSCGKLMPLRNPLGKAAISLGTNRVYYW